MMTPIQQILHRQIQQLDHMPELLRRKDVLKVTGWSKHKFYVNTDGHRIRMMGYTETRVPRVVIRAIVEACIGS